MRINSRISKTALFIYIISIAVSCKKFIEIAPPIDTITTGQVFESNAQAEWAMAGVYSRMINDDMGPDLPTFKGFYAGLSNIAGSLSADDLINSTGVSEVDKYVLYINALNAQNATLPSQIWKSAYKTIYDANGVIEGIEGSTSPLLSDSVRKQLTGEAKAVRAFAYFYLTNFFGDLPLVLTIDFNQTKNLSRSPQAKIYQQIIKDLTEAKAAVAGDFSVGKNERIRINKWFAEAFLARVYLYTGQYQDAINSATKVIGKNDLFFLETDLNRVFIKNSNEAIFQLAQYSSEMQMGTPEGKTFIPMLANYPPYFYYTDNVVNLFENTDKRKLNWMATYQESPTSPIVYYPYKYKTSRESGEPEEYYTVMRLAELYLIRAEANMLLSAGNTNSAIGDLNIIRQRAGVGDLPFTLTSGEVIDAVAEERRRELLTEGAHRWFDLKRTGKASGVLSAIPYKQPWKGDYQLLYPIPKEEIDANIRLTQNPQYNNF